MKKLINNVYLEDDHSAFKSLEGNRSVDDDRVKKIISSIKSVGMIQAPIVVNENMEVIDGQGRLEACKRLGEPVPYIIIPGLTINECRAMNINQENWSMFDYIKSHAECGNENYKRILDFLEVSGFKFQTSMWILLGSNASNKSLKIQKGDITISNEQLSKAIDLAVYLHNFDDIVTNRPLNFYMALTGCKKLQSVNPDELIKKVHQSPREFMNISSVLDCIDVLERVYNKRVSVKKHAYIKTEYLKMISEHNDGRKKIIEKRHMNHQKALL